MTFSTKLRSTVQLIPAVVIAFGLMGAAPEPDSSPIDPLEHVARATPATVERAAPVSTTENTTNAIDARVAGVDVTVPTDAEDPIVVDTDSGSLSIELPFAETAATAVREQSGIVSYDNKNGSITVPVVIDDGELQINTVIADSNAPTRYAYAIDPGDGGSLTPFGDLIVVGSATGEVIAVVEAPWALDANGRSVPTHYELSGTTLTQVIDLNDPSISYPVVADPKFVWDYMLPTVKTTRSETRQLMGVGAGPAGVGAAAKACQGYVAVAGIPGAVICGANIVSIMYNATNSYNSGKCSQLLIGPGVIGTMAYKDSYCR